MSYEINRLEEAWLKAESDADRVKREAREVSAVEAADLEAQMAAADQAAAEAFDRLWSAKGMNGTNA